MNIRHAGTRRLCPSAGSGILYTTDRKWQEESSPVGNKGTPGFDPARLRARRLDASISQAELARRADVPREYIAKYETGKVAPNIDRLADIARALGATPLDLLDPAQTGHGLAALRIAVGLRQADVADQAGPDMTLSRYRMLELGNIRRLTHADTASLAAVYGVPASTVRRAHQWDVDNAASLD